MMYLNVNNGYEMETIFSSNDSNKMEEMRKKAEKIFVDRELTVTTKCTKTFF